MSKVYNTPAYRKDKRVVSFIDPATKRRIVKCAKANKVSISREIGEFLEAHYK